MSRHPRLAIVGVAALLLMTAAGLVLALLAAPGEEAGFALRSRVALLELDGVIADDAELLDRLRRLRGDRSVKGFVVAINSPGGAVGPAQSLYRELKRIREEDGRPVVASIGAVGASGGYYVALAADSIFALPGSITGSIGVLVEVPNASRLMEKVGVQVEVVESAEHKDIGSPFRPLTPADRAVLDTVVTDLYRQFLEVVMTERHLDSAAVRRIADGRILSGRQALAEGLVDRLGNVNDALAAAGRMAGLGARPRILRPAEERPTLLELLLRRGRAASLPQPLRALDGPGWPRPQFLVPR